MSLRQRQEIQKVLRQKRIAALVFFIAGFWFAMMALLFKREALAPRLDSARYAPSSFWETPSDLWFAVLLADRTPIGYVNVRTLPEVRGDDAGARTDVTARLRLAMGGNAGEMFVSGRIWASRTEGLTDLYFKVRSGGHDTTVDAGVAAGILEGSIETGGERFPISFPVGRSLMLSSSPGVTSMTMPDLEVGEEFVVDTFDPLTMSLGKAKIRCEREEDILVAARMTATRVFTTELSGITSRAWVAADGEVVRAETPVGFVLEKTTQQVALDAMLEQAHHSDSLLQLAAIRPTGLRPARDARKMSVRFSGVDENSPVPSDETQTIGEGCLYTIRPLAPSEDGERAAAPGKDWSDYLASDTFVQSDHKQIRDLAAQIVGSETDPWRKATLLNDWVEQSIEKRPVLSVPSALDVLQTREGDCNEHTVLYTALARAAGVPTRIVIGVVWSDEHEAFYYHAWPEVFVGRWVWTDPTFGQHVADATHIKLLSGGIERWWQLVPFLGRLKIDVLHVE